MTRIVISDPEEGKAYQIEPEESQFESLIGLSIGDRFEGDRIGLPGYELKVTGGSDEEGFPMRGDVKGEGRTRAVFSGGPGYNPSKEGLRKRKTIRGGRISRNIAQLNTTIEEKGEKSIEEILGFGPIEEGEGREPEETPGGEAEEVETEGEKSESQSE